MKVTYKNLWWESYIDAHYTSTDNIDLNDPGIQKYWAMVKDSEKELK